MQWCVSGICHRCKYVDHISSALCRWPSGRLYKLTKLKIISWPSGRLHIRRCSAAYACQEPLPMMGPPPRGLNRLLIRRLIGENIQSSPARPAGATPSYGWPLVNQPFIGMVGPWLAIYSLYGGYGWPLVSPCLYRQSDTKQARVEF